MDKTYFIKREKCPACNSCDSRDLYRVSYTSEEIKAYLSEFYGTQGVFEESYLEKEDYILKECTNCRLIYQYSIPNDFLMKRLYEIWIDPDLVFQSVELEYGVNYYSKYAQELQQIISFFKEKPSSLDILDYGMGWGRWALMAKAFGCKVFGYDLSQSRIEYARANGVDVLNSEMLTKQKYDFINTEQVFEHIDNPLDTLIFLKKQLKPGGFIKISVPTANNINYRLKEMDWTAAKGDKKSLNPVAPLEHINYFRRSSLEKMISNAGMVSFDIPMNIQYRYSSDWSSLFSICRNLLLPLWRNLFKKQNYIFCRIR